MHKAKVLVVDDKADFRDMVRFALERAGYAVLEADNGARALTVIDHGKPDLVLVDVNMPVMSGTQLVEELRRRGDVHAFGIIAVSGAINARSSPTKWFLAKPVDIGLLLNVVGDFCGQRSVSPLWVREQQRESLEAFDATMSRCSG